MVAFLLGVAFIYGAQTVALVLASDERLGTGPEGYGYLLGALGAGGVIAAPITNRLAAARRVGPTLLGALVLTALPLALLAVVSSPVVATALMVVSGAGGTAVDVLAITLLQRAVSDDVRGRVFGLLDSAVVLAILAGSLDRLASRQRVRAVMDARADRGRGERARHSGRSPHLRARPGRAPRRSTRWRRSSTCSPASPFSSSRSVPRSSSSRRRRASRRSTRAPPSSRKASPPMTSLR